jgi:hypothetical protein
VNYAFATQAVGLVIEDANNDGRFDLVSASRTPPQRFGYLAGRADFTFEPARYFNMMGSPSRFALADLDLDSDLDFAAPIFNSGIAMTVRNFGGGVFNSGSGCASGDYWLNLNVANVPTGAPDPVPILRAQLDARRADFLGQTDAIRSSVELDPSAVRADGVNTAQLTITLRDWQNQDIPTSPNRVVEVMAAPDADLGTTVGPVTPGPGDTYTTTITTGNQTGTARFVVRVLDSPAARPVVLMPEAELRLLHAADWDLSGEVNSADFMEFLQDFMNGDAEFNHDGAVNSQDFFDFLQAFFST